MKRFSYRKVLGCLFLCLTLVGISQKGVFAAKEPKEPDISTSTAVLMDGDTGEVLYNKNMNRKRYPASTTKVMTALLAIENSSLTDQVTIGENAMKYVTPDNSHIDARLGEVFTMEQCLYAMLLVSANEISAQVAEQIAGSEENFAKMMNDRAREIGCKRTNFTNASGLHDKEHYSTAYDMALILQEAIKNPTFVEINSKTGYTILPTNMYADPRNLMNHHAMFFEGGEYYCEGIFAGKTGYTKAAHNALLTAAKRNGITLVSAVLRCDDLDYIHDTQKLMDYGFNNYETIKAKKAADRKKKEAEAVTPTPEPTAEPTPTPTILPKDMGVPEEFHTTIKVLIGLNVAAVFVLVLILCIRKKHSKK